MRSALSALVLGAAMLLAVSYAGGGQTAVAAVLPDATTSSDPAPASESPATSATDALGDAADGVVVGTVPAAAAPDQLVGIPPRSAQLPLAAAYQSGAFKVVTDVPFTSPVDCGGGQSCQGQLDVYVPSGPGSFPIVVLVGPGGRGYLASFAGHLARLGILVFNADFRDVAGSGGGYPAGFQDVACAIRFARSQASVYGGDAGPVTLAGHSLGGWVGSVVALDPTEFEGGCLADGSGRPDAFVGLSGNYQIDGGENASDLYPFFGGSAAVTAQARAASNPFNFATGTPIPVRLVAGTADETVDPAQSIALNAFLLNRGWNVALTLVPDGSHMSIVSSQSAYDAVFSAMSAARSSANAIDPIKGRGGQ